MAVHHRRPAPLTCHPATPAAAITAVRAAGWPAGDDCLAFRFELEGDLQRLRLPDAGTGSRRDGLWEHTCCEAFVACGTAGYVEFNFAPDGDWAAYRFSAYRERGHPDPAMPPPAIAARREPGRFVLEAKVNIAGIEELEVAAGTCLGLAVVVEENGAARSYWALGHESDRPDFHAPGTFLHTLAAGTGTSPGKELAL